MDTTLVNTVGMRRYKEDGVGYYFSDKLIDWLGPRRKGDVADEPYIHYAASMQQLFEDWCLELIETYLGDVLRETGRLAFAGGGALNVKLNQRIVALDHVDELFVQPAAGDSGTSLGAATFVAAERGETLGRMNHAYLGPAYDEAACLTALKNCAEPIAYRKLDNVPAETADILAAGNPVAWFQGRMEFGPRALGGRSILGCPSAPGIADRINEQIKFRERWRPFCPSVLDTVAADIIQTEHPAPFMTITFDVNDAMEVPRIPEVVHEDGTARVQIVSRDQNPRYYALIEALGAAHRQCGGAQHVPEPPRRAHGLFTGGRAGHVLRLRSAIPGARGLSGDEGRPEMTETVDGACWQLP